MSSTAHDTGHEITAPGRPRLEEVGDGVFAYLQPDGTWWINNTGFVAGSRGVISVDSCSTERRTRAYLEAVRSVTDRPVRTLVNTHHHGDHTFGNHLFGGATIVAHERTREGVLAWGEPVAAPIWTDVDWGEFTLEPPFLTYTEGVTVWADDLRCEVRHVGTPAHTTNDSIVWIPDRDVLFCGDLLFNGGTPFLLQGSVAGAITVLEEVVAPLGAGTIVPGHGPVAGPELIDRVLGYLRFVQATARAGREAGLSPLDAARETDLGPYAELTDPERLVGNLHRAYSELDGAPLGAEIDTLTALSDMITYNGGRPLTCRA
ncbi:MBL fold metallo-hydrolase [Spirillospora sp. NPDC029432]|uniref:MBL fold metallo-hydrolase n=1 Tax=Spirillospora sp. NPDC029432 TaxID=3154599 RepID=UPI0034568E68